MYTHSQQISEFLKDLIRILHFDVPLDPNRVIYSKVVEDRMRENWKSTDVTYIIDENTCDNLGQTSRIAKFT